MELNNLEIKTLSLENIYFAFQDLTVLDNLTIKAKNNGIHAILGPNGSGKSILNSIIALMRRPQHGKISWNNEDMTNRQKIEFIRKIGFMWQKPIFLTTSVFNNIEYPLKIRNLAKEERKKKVKKIIKEFRFEEIEDKAPTKLSIGTQQRLALARTLITNPKLLILDEPTASLDMANTKWFEEFIKDYYNNSTPMIFWTSHDHFQVKRIAKTISVLVNGVAETGNFNALKQSNTKEIQAYLNGQLI